MPTDPFDDVTDDDHTDELPVLVETVVLGAAAPLAPDGEPLEDTAERTARYRSLEPDTTAEIESLQTDLAARGAKIATLEEDIARLSARWAEVEAHMTARDARIGELNRTLAEMRRIQAEHHAAEEQLNAKLVERGAEVARLNGENEALRAAAETAQANLTALASQQAAERPDPATSATVAALRQEIESLGAYIANRNDWWRELKAVVAASTSRIDALQRELRDLSTAQRAATALGARESARATRLRGELVAATHTIENLRRELSGARAASAQGAGTARSAAAGARDPATAQAAASGSRASASEAVATDPREAAAQPAGESLQGPALEAVAAMEAEIAYKRQQIAAQLVELREREQRLDESATTIERLRQDLAALRAELEQRRADVGRLERAVVDKDRALAARDARIATLQEELSQRLGAIQKLNAMDVSLQGLSSKMSDRLRRSEPAAEVTSAPTLVCLTGDAPKQLALTKKTITIGRGQDCDIQILTHFVSREHARITTDGGSVIIEDLASTNGVFVNSVRVDRHELHHGDLLTIGETQFRFLESMAH